MKTNNPQTLRDTLLQKLFPNHSKLLNHSTSETNS